jgi:hypothetical protein
MPYAHNPMANKKNKSQSKTKKKGDYSYPNSVIIDALRKTHGLVFAAAKIVGCTGETIKKRIEADPEVKVAALEARELKIDFAESKLMQAVDAGEGWAVCFFLKTQAKDRGYVERQEMTGDKGGPITLKVVYEEETELKDA